MKQIAYVDGPESLHGLIRQDLVLAVHLDACCSAFGLQNNGIDAIITRIEAHTYSDGPSQSLGGYLWSRKVALATFTTCQRFSRAKSFSNWWSHAMGMAKGKGVSPSGSHVGEVENSALASTHGFSAHAHSGSHGSSRSTEHITTTSPCRRLCKQCRFRKDDCDSVLTFDEVLTFGSEAHHGSPGEVPPQGG